MAKDPFEQFAIPNEMRSFAEQSVAQARQAFDGFLQAANQAMGQFQGQAQAARSGAQEIAQKTMTYAEQNVAATFDFAQKLRRARTPPSSWDCNRNISPARCRQFRPRFRILAKVPPKWRWKLASLRPDCAAGIFARIFALARKVPTFQSLKIFVQCNIFCCIAPKMCYIKS